MNNLDQTSQVPLDLLVPYGTTINLDGPENPRSIANGVSPPYPHLKMGSNAICLVVEEMDLPE